MKPLLEVNDLHVHFAGTHAVKGVSLSMQPGEILAIVGESGSGKTATAQAIIQLQQARLKGEIWFEQNNLLQQSPKQLRTIRGKKIGMIFQDPMTSLNPTMRIGKQIAEPLRLHCGLSRTESRQTVLELLEAVGISYPELRIDQYPHEFSGGMRQRAMIAMALACKPALLIADEPTTALDTTTQAQILQLLKQLNQKHDTAILLITHDLRVVASTADRIAVMYQGKIVETGTAQEVLANPQHDYTKTLLAAKRRQMP